MDLDDIGSYSHAERTRRFLKNFYGKTGGSPDLTSRDVDGAQGMATAEMLDEIHTMLRELLSRTAPQ